jgi:mRNA interferase MazF
MDSQTGRERAGRRPALVMSPGAYNGKVGLAILCPITSQGVILSDQAKSLD